MYKILFCLIIAFLLTGCNQSENLESVLPLREGVVLETVFKSKCENDMDIYYQSGTKRLYLNCIESIEVVENENKVSLKDYLNQEENDIDGIINSIVLNLNDSYESDNNTVYKDESITVISCSSLNKTNDDFLIGKSSADNDLERVCVTEHEKYKITATVTEVYEGEMVVENVEDDTEKYIITKIDAFESDIYENLKAGIKIIFSYNGSIDLTDPPKIRALDITILK